MKKLLQLTAGHPRWALSQNIALPPPLCAGQCEATEARPISLCALPPPCVQVNVKRGLSYLRCTSGQASTVGMPCEAGVVAYDEVDGASIQDRVRDDLEGAWACPHESSAAQTRSLSV